MRTTKNRLRSFDMQARKVNIDEKTKIPLQYAVSTMVLIVGTIVWMYAFFAQVKDMQQLRIDLQSQVVDVKQDQMTIKEDVKKILEYVSYIKGKMDRGR